MALKISIYFYYQLIMRVQFSGKTSATSDTSMNNLRVASTHLHPRTVLEEEEAWKLRVYHLNRKINIFARVQFSGKTSAFQADVVGSIPITRLIWACSSAGQSARLISVRSVVQVHSGPLLFFKQLSWAIDIVAIVSQKLFYLAKCLKFFLYSAVAQWQSIRLLTERSQVRILPAESFRNQKKRCKLQRFFCLLVILIIFRIWFFFC